jgi:hypothetical protein
MEAHCIAWLNQFVDGTFRREAQHVTYIQEYNETLANSQSPEEKARWIELHSTMARVWHDKYRQEEALQHIRMILCETAIGNDIPWQIAEAAAKYDCVLGWHPYVVCRVGNVSSQLETRYPVRYDAPRAAFHDWSWYREQVWGAKNQRFRGVVENAAISLLEEPYIMQESLDESIIYADDGWELNAVSRPDYVSPHDWRWYSGRWATMDADFMARGIHIDWSFGEGGPVLDASTDWSGWLDPLGGWKNPDCLNGDFNKYLNVLKYWLDNTVQTQAYREGRILGLQLFTSGAPGGSGGTWANFDLVQPEMDAVADFAAAYPYPPTGEPPDPDPDPDPPEDCEGLPREQYKRRVLVVPGNATKEQWLDVCAVAYDERQTVTGSYDDAGIGALDNKTAILYDIPNKQEFIDWYAEHYPGTVVEFRSYPGAYEIVDIVDELPTHPIKEYNTRSLDAIDDLIIHHTVSPDSRTSEQIAVYHVNTKDWPGIAYHFVIGADGGIEVYIQLMSK